MSYMQSMHDFLNVVDLNAKSGVACAHDALSHPMLLTRHGSHVGMTRLSVPMLLRSCSLSCSCDCHITLSCLVRESRGCRAALVHMSSHSVGCGGSSQKLPKSKSQPIVLGEAVEAFEKATKNHPGAQADFGKYKEKKAFVCSNVCENKFAD